MSENKYILVIGANHWDIFANYHPDQKDYLDKEGRVSFSLGGTALNIAYNLASDQKPTYLLTAINPNTLGGQYLQKYLKEFKIGDRYCIKNKTLKEGAFVAIQSEKNLKEAVTETTIESKKLDKEIKKQIEEAINEETSIVVAECNLYAKQLANVFTQCCHKNKKLLIDGVSEGKCKRLIRIFRQIDVINQRCEERKIEVFSCDLKEFISIIRYAIEEGIISINENNILVPEKWSKKEISQEARSQICSQLHVKFFVVCDKNNWNYFILDETGGQEFKRLNRAKTIMGVGDAIMSGVAGYYYENNKDDPSWKPNWNNAHSYIVSSVNDLFREPRRKLTPATDISEIAFGQYRQDTAKAVGFLRIAFFIFLISTVVYAAWLTSKNNLPTGHFIAILSIVIVSMLLMLRLLPSEVLLKLADKIPNIPLSK